MMPQRQLHFNADVFGDRVTEFNAWRFLDQTKLKRHASFRPFGGGTTLCPGRFLAKQTTLAFVASLIHRFDVLLNVPGQGFPEATVGNPSIGLVDVKEGSDLRVRLTVR